jgi:aryl-alcohol dehydrogenase-like predicted oxidoreductase
MEKRSFGRSGLEVPVVGMGTWRTFDVHGAAAEARCREIVDVALRTGARLFDSSPMYGRAERVLAGTLSGRRHQALVATKVWAGSRAEGQEQIERALDWFGGRVDVYQVHNLLGWREHLPYLRDLQAQGRVGVVGVTHYNPSAFPDLLRVIQSGLVDQVQLPYNAAAREVEREILPAAAERGLGVIVMQPLGVGALAQRAPAAEALRFLPRFGIRTWAQALLKWILSDARVHTVIPATSSPDHMAENAEAGDPPWLDAPARDTIAGLVSGR